MAHREQAKPSLTFPNYWQMDAFTNHLFCLSRRQKEKKKIWRQKPQAQTSKTVSVECDLKFLVRKSNLIYCNTHTSTPKPKVLTPKATPWWILSPPSPGQAPGAGLSRQHRAPICASHRTVLDKSLQVGRGATSAPPARAPPPPPGWPPVSGVPLTCRRSVAGCHIFQPLGLAEETLGDSVDCAWGRGAAAPLYIWGWCRGVSVLEPATAAGQARGAARRRRRRRARLPATCGHGRAPLSWRSCERTAQLCPGPSARRRRRRPLPPPPPTAAAPGPAL